MWILIFIVMGTMVEWGRGQLPVSTCQNLDTKACILYHKAKPDLCNDPMFANGPCKRFCGNCPLECYSCLTPVYFPDDCNTTSACGTDETCVLKHLRSPDGHNEYVMACEHKQVCQSLGFRNSLVGKRDAHAQSRQERGVSITCCDVDFCNYPSTTTARTTALSTTPSTRLITTPSTRLITRPSSRLTTLPTTLPPTTTSLPTTTTTRKATTTTRLTTPSSTISTVKTTMPTSITTTNTSAIYCKRDVVFVLDDSGSVGSIRFNLTLNFASSLVSRLQIGPNSTQVAMLVFSNQARIQWHLGKYQRKAGLLDAITKVQHLGGITRTHEALNTVGTEIFQSSHGDRDDADNVVILTSDGQSTFKEETVKAAKTLHSRASHVITLLLGHDVDMGELTAIATDQHHVFNVQDYNKLQTFLPRVIHLACGN